MWVTFSLLICLIVLQVLLRLGMIEEALTDEIEQSLQSPSEIAERIACMNEDLFRMYGVMMVINLMTIVSPYAFILMRVARLKRGLELLELFPEAL
mmetsp:Transcript_687/g.750  ORF Transcript_687/g.750 Transcript_687/m.750 type:complete len:96 (+) Transcript_687:491-778(+)